jgi:hypothetical protein
METDSGKYADCPDRRLDRAAADAKVVSATVASAAVAGGWIDGRIVLVN